MKYRCRCIACGDKAVDLGELTDEEILGVREGSFVLPLRDAMCVTCLLLIDIEVDVLTGRAV